ncbi:hypothetical protein DSC45_22345 [Streptomyces sp. YIM 130001]|uniref:hypothetical protein n=1 Tax=Streptomyces sp. YIM 130001 TaxID=2259644 RepID=UPI000E64D0DC|nr:hypothetical protein [Streptomyces sp. YIM 130001]RII13696.1 hypothetical protein DSC45_22345 [Streptomyces sp. YIM 130001]
MNPNTILTYSQVLPPGQNRYPTPRHPTILGHPERTPTRHATIPARSASTRQSNREDRDSDLLRHWLTRALAAENAQDIFETDQPHDLLPVLDFETEERHDP